MVCEKPNALQSPARNCTHLHTPALTRAASEMGQVLYYEYYHDRPKNSETPSYAASNSDICRYVLWNKRSSDVPHLQVREEMLVVLSTPHLFSTFCINFGMGSIL